MSFMEFEHRDQRSDVAQNMASWEFFANHEDENEGSSSDGSFSLNNDQVISLIESKFGKVVGGSSLASHRVFASLRGDFVEDHFDLFSMTKSDLVETLTSDYGFKSGQARSAYNFIHLYSGPLESRFASVQGALVHDLVSHKRDHADGSLVALVARQKRAEHPNKLTIKRRGKTKEFKRVAVPERSSLLGNVNEPPDTSVRCFRDFATGIQATLSEAEQENRIPRTHFSSQIASLFQREDSSGHIIHERNLMKLGWLTRWVTDQYLMNFLANNWDKKVFDPFLTTAESESLLNANMEQFIVRLSSSFPGFITVSLRHGDGSCVHRRFRVLSDHSIRGNGGLQFANFDSFVTGVKSERLIDGQNCCIL